MTRQELNDKCIALMKKLGLWDDKEKLNQWCKDYIVSMDKQGELVVKKRSEIDPLEYVGFVLCATYDPFMTRTSGSFIDKCHDCGVTIVISPDSPVDPPKVCNHCGTNRINKELNQ